MALEVGERHGTQIVVAYSIFTCICIPLILIFLTYTDNLYNIGKYNCAYVVAVLAALECFKLLWCIKVKTDPLVLLTKDVKSSRMRKYCGKIKLKDILKCIVAMCAMTIIYFLCAIFFGASILSKHEETLMLSVLITILTVFPGCIHVGVDITISLLAGMKPLPGDLLTEMIQRNIQCTLFGAWFGAVVIPLDWNRPWQQWPIPCSVGALLGYTLAHILTLVYITMPSIVKYYSKSKLSV